MSHQPPDDAPQRTLPSPCFRMGTSCNPRVLWAGSFGSLDIRRTSRFTFCVSLMVLTTVVGCVTQRFGGQFEFTNKSNTELYVIIYGIEGNPPCGILMPDGNAGSFMGPTRLPKQVDIRWSEGHDSHKNPNAKEHIDTVSLSSLSNCPVDATLVFEFTSNRVWRVSCKQR